MLTYGYCILNTYIIFMKSVKWIKIVLLMEALMFTQNHSS